MIKRDHPKKVDDILDEAIFIDKKTGKERTMKVVKMKLKDINFQKIWVSHFLEAVEAVGNQKVKVMMWLINNRNSENLVIATQQQIAKETECVRQTVASTLQALVDAEALIVKANGVYQISPSLIFKGGSDKRASILLEYESDAVSEKSAKRTAKANKEARPSAPAKAKKKTPTRPTLHSYEDQVSL